MRYRTSMQYYPIFVKLENKDCLVVGAGQVGRRKIRSLVDAGARRVIVVETAQPDADLSEIIEHPVVEFHNRGFEDSDLDGKFLVIASTSNEDVNWRISNLCAERGIPCNIVDQPEKCSFIVPATVKRGDLTIAISTSGSSPALAKKIRRELQCSFGAEYEMLLEVMKRIRTKLLTLGRPTEENTVIFRALVNSELLEVFGKCDLDAAAEILKTILPNELNESIPELLDGIG